MIEVEAAIEKVKAHIVPQQKIKHVSLDESVGYVLGEDIYAQHPVPDFPRSAMDGYAVVAKDISFATTTHPVCLPVIGKLFAGDDPTSIPFQVHSAVKIMTGAGIPSGYDAVIKQELTDLGQKEVRIYQAVPKGKNYSPIGEDVKKGQLVLKKGIKITPEVIGVCASLGYTTLPILKPLRVGLISTGSELIAPGKPLTLGKIYNSTIYTLAAIMRQHGADVVFEHICQDDVHSFVSYVMKKKETFDLLVTTGGVSVGEKDFLPLAMKQLKAKEIFHCVKMKPGTPVMASAYQDKVILSFSGNPFASMVNFHLFYWPVVSHFYQNNRFELKKMKVPISNGNLDSTGLRRFIRANYENGSVRIPEKGQHPSVFHTLATSNCLIEQPAKEVLKKGDIVTIYHFPS